MVNIIGNISYIHNSGWGFVLDSEDTGKKYGKIYLHKKYISYYNMKLGDNIRCEIEKSNNKYKGKYHVKTILDLERKIIQQPVIPIPDEFIDMITGKIFKEPVRIISDGKILPNVLEKEIVLDIIAKGKGLCPYTKNTIHSYETAKDIIDKLQFWITNNKSSYESILIKENKEIEEEKKLLQMQQKSKIIVQNWYKTLCNDNNYIDFIYCYLKDVNGNDKFSKIMYDYLKEAIYKNDLVYSIIKNKNDPMIQVYKIPLYVTESSKPDYIKQNREDNEREEMLLDSNINTQSNVNTVFLNISTEDMDHAREIIQTLTSNMQID